MPYNHFKDHLKNANNSDMQLILTTNPTHLRSSIGEVKIGDKNHIFYVAGKGWIEAGQILPKDKVMLKDGSLEEVTQTENVATICQMHN